MLEAMACGVPTIAADNSCLPEVSGGVLRYFNAESVEEMADTIVRALEDQDLREQLSRDGIARARQFRWERCGRETLTAIQELISQTT
jgi:glycosyltransferase involved in cell wall biosynthesis